MFDPVNTSDGEVYEREAIEEWLKNHDTCPRTNTVLPTKNLIPSKGMKRMISGFLDKHPAVKLSDQYYLPKTLVTQIRTACQENSIENLKRLVETDVRLLLKPYEDHDLRTLLHEVCELSQVSLVQSVVQWLEDYETGSSLSLLDNADMTKLTPLDLAIDRNPDLSVSLWLGSLLGDRVINEMADAMKAGELATPRHAISSVYFSPLCSLIKAYFELDKIFF